MSDYDDIITLKLSKAEYETPSLSHENKSLWSQDRFKVHLKTLEDTGVLLWRDVVSLPACSALCWLTDGSCDFSTEWTDSVWHGHGGGGAYDLYCSGPGDPPLQNVKLWLAVSEMHPGSRSPTFSSNQILNSVCVRHLLIKVGNSCHYFALLICLKGTITEHPSLSFRLFSSTFCLFRVFSVLHKDQ